MSTELRRLVGSSPALAGGPAVESIDVRPFPGATSYAARVVTLRLGDGSRIELFLKDYTTTRLPKHDAAAQRRREIGVYRHLLDGAGLDTPRCYGALCGAAEQAWLLLEMVDGVPLREAGFEARVDAAAWLGRMHAVFAGREAELARLPWLVRHDARYFQRCARRAVEAVGALDGVLAGRLGEALRGYDRIIALMAAGPATLVHGSFRSQNVLVARRGARGRRIAPIDWEHAALGAPLYDLAFLSAGCGEAKSARLFGAWRGAAADGGVAVPDEAEARRLVRCFGLHKVVRSLGDAVVRRFAPRSVRTLVTMAGEISRAVV